MKWTDSLDIAMALDEAHPEVDPLSLGFVQLHAWVLELADFEDAPENSSERILEAIQMAWIEERED